MATRKPFDTRPRWGDCSEASLRNPVGLSRMRRSCLWFVLRTRGTPMHTTLACASSLPEPRRFTLLLCAARDSEFPNTTFLRLPRNFGNTKALNIGMRTAVGELIFFLSPEIEVAQDTLSILTARLESDSELMAVSPVIVDSTTGQPVEQF